MHPFQLHRGPPVGCAAALLLRRRQHPRCIQSNQPSEQLATSAGQSCKQPSRAAQILSTHHILFPSYGFMSNFNFCVNYFINLSCQETQYTYISLFLFYFRAKNLINGKSHLPGLFFLGVASHQHFSETLQFFAGFISCMTPGCGEKNKNQVCLHLSQREMHPV